LLLFSYVFESSIGLAAPEQTARSAQMRGEFGQWLGSMFMQGSSVRKFWFEEKPLEAHHVRDEGVAGSNPATPTKFPI
jgi:hypothetical protein